MKRSRKQQKSNKKDDRTGRKDLAIARNFPSYPGQKIHTIELSQLPIVSSTTVTTGEIALASQITITNINGWNPRFQNTWVEYRIVRCSAVIIPFSSTNPGLITVWFDEKVASAPTVQESVQKNVKMLGASRVNSPLRMTWIARDPLDLEFQPIGTAVTPVTLKVYTNNANWGSSVVATPYFLTKISVEVQFRGLQ